MSNARVFYGITSAERSEVGIDLDFLLEVDEQQYEAMQQALSAIHRLGPRDMYRLIERNFADFDRTLGFYEQLFAVPRARESVAPRDAANGVIVSAINFLNACRLFLDHEETWIKRGLRT